MATAEIGNRQVLRPAGNIVAKGNNSLKKATKPAFSHPTSPTKTKISPANANINPPIAISPPKLPLLPAKHSPKLHPITSPCPINIALPLIDDEPSAHVVNPNQNIAITATILPKSPSCSSPNSCGAPLKKSLVKTNNKKLDQKKLDLKKLHSVRFDEASLATIVAEKKANASEVSAQRKLKVAEYGRKQIKSSRIVPSTEVSTSSSSSSSLSPFPPIELKRCKFITAQTDPLYIAYHDEEWGVPVHDDRMLFELLVLAGFQGELSWSAILHKRDAYRASFSGFDATSVALFTEKHIQCLEADKKLGLSKSKIRGVVENAQRILEVVREFGSLNDYLWGFFNKQPLVNDYRYPKQVPAKTSKAESISKELVKRGFRSVGPTTVYSFMQASGMTNDHLVQCFRHQECIRVSSLLVDGEQNQDRHVFKCAQNVESTHGN